MVHHDLNSLVQQNIEMVRLLWCDLVGITRGIAHRIDELQASPWAPFATVEMALGVMVDQPKLDCPIPTTGQVFLHLDESSLRVLPYAPGHASAYGNLLDENAQPWQFCPRTFLQRQIERLGQMGLHMQAAFESEFVLFTPTEEGLSPTDHHLYASVQSLNMKYAVLEDMRAALTVQDIKVLGLLAESASGQHEVVIEHSDLLQAADQQLVVRETVHAIAHQHGMVASFLPVLFSEEGGNGSHVHFSLWRDGVNVTGDQESASGLSSWTQHFMAGVLRHLPSMLAVTTPTTNSFRRLQPGHWSGAFQGWGFNNRGMPLRVPTQPAPKLPSNIEFKSCDATANPYLALGVLLAAGMNGLEESSVLGKPVPTFPEAMSSEDLKALGAVRLPDSLAKSLDHFEENRVFAEAMGDDLFDSYLGIKRDEEKSFSMLSLEDEIECLLDRH